MPIEFLEDEQLLENEFAFARVSPWGATLTELVINDLQVVGHASVDDVRDSFAGVTLAPWPNRLAGASWNYNNQSLATAINDGKGNANHGLVFNKKFEVKSQTSESITFVIALGEDRVYPFDVEIQVSYELIGAELTSSITAKNIGAQKAPVAFGTHPYICVTPKSKITINAATQTTNDENQIPIGTRAADPIVDAEYSSLALDDCFADLERDASGKATTQISNPDGTQILLWQDSVFKYLMVYTHPSLGIAIEPQTAPANALNSGVDLAWLEVGEAITGSWGIRVNSDNEETR